MLQVVAICGMMGSGKSTLLTLLQDHLPDCIALQEDDFNPAPMQSVAEVQGWWERGANVEEFDLSLLKSAITAEATKATTNNHLILLETQFGRQHSALRPLIDVQIWIDVQADIAFARKVKQFSQQMLDDTEARSPEDSLAWITDFCDSYLQTTHKLFAHQRQQVAGQSDERINAAGCPHDVCNQLLSILSPLVSEP